MDTTIIAALIGGPGLAALGGAGWLFRNLLKNKDEQISRILTDAEKSVARAEHNYDAQLATFQKRLSDKERECELERQRADSAEQKYVAVLIADIEERKQRDRTLEVLSKVAAHKEAEL